MNVVQVTPDPYPQFVVMTPNGRLFLQTADGRAIVYYTREAAEFALAQYEAYLADAETVRGVITRSEKR